MANTPHGLTQEELDALAPEEREALEADLSDDEKNLASGGDGVTDGATKPDADPLKDPPRTEIEGADDKDEDDDPAKTKAAAGGDNKAAGAAAGADAGAEAGAATGAQDEERERGPLVVPFQAPAVDPEKVKAALADLKHRFDEGEITIDEMLDQRDAINRQVTEASLAAKHQAQTELRLWEDEVDRFLDTHEAYKDPILYESLNERVKALASDKANANLTNRKILERAHEDLAKRFKVDGEAAAATKPDAKKELEQKRKPDLSGVPRTLHDAPHAAPPSVEGDEFAHLEALMRKAEAGDADAQAQHERALAKLTPEQQDRYLQSA